MEPDTLVPYGALAIASVSALLALRSSHIANKAFSLAKAQDDRRQPKLELQLTDFFIAPTPPEQPRHYCFDISITNRSDTQNSVRRVHLTIGCTLAGGIASTLVLEHSVARPDIVPTGGPVVLTVPSLLQPHSILGAWAFFLLPRELLKDTAIDSYTVFVEDSHGNAFTKDAIFLRERENG